MKGMLWMCTAQMLHSSRETPIIIPYSPRVPPSTINKNRSSVTEPYREGITKELMAVRATIITMGAPISPARTADSPMTNAPTILTACPTALGKRSPASRMTSNRKWINRASTTRGKGVARSDLK